MPSLPAAPSSTAPSEPRVLARRDRWRRRSAAWRLGDWLVRQELEAAGDVPGLDPWLSVPFKRTAGCGRCVVSDDGQVELRSKDGTVYTSGLQTCGSVWNCTVCRAKIQGHRQLEVAAAGRVHAARGGAVGMLTLTVRHHRTDDLAQLVKGIRKAWSDVQRTRAWRVWRPYVQGTITALEVTRGDNGWHPHLHVLILGQTTEGLEELAKVAQAEWATQVVRTLGGDHRPNATNGVDWTGAQGGNDAAALARYVSKLSAEVTRGDWKARDVLAELLDGVDAGEVEAVARYIEWSTAMHGRNQLVWSRGLRAQLRALAVDQADTEAVELLTKKADEEVAAEERGGEHVAYVDRRTWHRACRTRGAAGCTAILEHFERLGAPPPAARE